MAKDKNRKNAEDLTEADKAVLRLYEETKTPIEWDESDDAILSFARSIHETAEDATPVAESETEDSTVVPFRRPQARPPASIFRSPLVGLAIAASLMLGVFIGQGVSPFVNLGVSPDYAQIIEDNERLAMEVARFGDFQGAEDYVQVLEENRRLQSEIESLKHIDTTPGAEDIGTPLEGPAEISDLSQLLGSFDCAALTASATPNAPMVIEGYVASSEDLARLGDGLAALGLQGGHVNRAEVAGAPFCGALETLHSQTEVGSALRGAPLVRPYQHGLDYLQGENLVLAATATSRFDGYLYVDLVLPDGRVRHLQPGAGGSPATVPAGQELVLGDGEGGQVIEAPFGRQLAIVLSTPRPLFEAPRPEIEEAEPYFADLRAALEALSREAPSAVVLSGYSFLSTRSAD